jgi:hypothetical protein
VLSRRFPSAVTASSDTPDTPIATIVDSAAARTSPISPAVSGKERAGLLTPRPVARRAQEQSRRLVIECHQHVEAFDNRAAPGHPARACDVNHMAPEAGKPGCGQHITECRPTGRGPDRVPQLTVGGPADDMQIRGILGHAEW